MTTSRVATGAIEWGRDCWLLLPRMSTRAKALPVFIGGLAMAEGCGLLGLLLGGENRNTLVVLAFLGLLQYAPVFAKKFEA